MSEQRDGAIGNHGVWRMSDNNFHLVDQRPLAFDILKGMREITLYLRGTSDKNAIRSMYHLTETSNTIPTFKQGAMTCALKSSIRATIWMQEKRAWRSEEQELLVRAHVLLNSILTLMSGHNGHANDNHGRAQLSDLMAEAERTIQRVLQIGGG